MYLYENNEKLLIDSYDSKKNIFKLKFCYGGNDIFDEQSKVEDYFSGDNVKIIVS